MQRAHQFRGRVEDAVLHRLELADGTVVSGRDVVISAGSRPVIPPVFTAEGAAPFHTNDTIMRLDALPGRVIIVGGGYIAAEFAHVFAGLGAEVTVVARGERLLRSGRILPVELDMALALAPRLQGKPSSPTRPGRRRSRTP